MGSHANRLFALLTATIALGAFACDRTPPPEDDPKSDAGSTVVNPVEPVRPVVDTSVLFTPREVFTGFDGTRTFSFPIAVDGSDTRLPIVASDPSAFDIVPAKIAVRDEENANDKGIYYLVTVKKAGTFTLTTTLNGKTATATVNVAAYTPDRWVTGERRYKTGPASGATQPCVGCHTQASEAPDHSPAELAGVDDTRARETITEGVLADGTVIADYFPYDHHWQATEAELNGLVTYLRALPQKKVVAE